MFYDSITEFVFHNWPLAVFILEDALSVWANLGKYLLFVRLFVSSLKTGTRRIIRLDELSSFIRLERRTTKNSLSRRIMRLVPVFILKTNNQTNNKSLPEFVQTDNASSSINRTITQERGFNKAQADCYLKKKHSRTVLRMSRLLFVGSCLQQSSGLHLPNKNKEKCS